MDLGFARVNARFAQMESKFDARFAQMESRFDARFAQVESKFDARFADMDAKSRVGFAAVDARFADLGKQMERQTSRLILWSFAFWVTTLATIAGVALKP
jgi:hypothetical protein